MRNSRPPRLPRRSAHRAPTGLIDLSDKSIVIGTLRSDYPTKCNAIAIPGCDYPTKCIVIEDRGPRLPDKMYPHRDPGLRLPDKICRRRYPEPHYPTKNINVRVMGCVHPRKKCRCPSLTCGSR